MSTGWVSYKDLHSNNLEHKQLKIKKQTNKQRGQFEKIMLEMAEKSSSLTIRDEKCFLSGKGRAS